MSPPRLLYDLAGADSDLRFSPNCWRIRLALAHKGLEVETIAWRFTEKEAIAPSGQGKVPVLVDDGVWLSESFAIAGHLEDTYPDAPSLFGSPEGRALARFVNQWANDTLHPAVAQLILPDILAVLHDKDRAYFRQTREAAFGTTLEELAARREQSQALLRRVLKPLRGTLAAQPFLGGAQPTYADYAVFGAVQWARVVGRGEIFLSEAPLAAWAERLLDAHGGLARAAPIIVRPSSNQPAQGPV